MLKIGEDLFDLLYPVGSYYETSNTSWTPSSAGWYGTWVEDTNGRVTVSQNSSTFKTVGATGGEETHTLTTSEIPSHSHQGKAYFYGYSEWTGASSGNVYVYNWSSSNCIVNQNSANTSKLTYLCNQPNTGNTGGSGSHNNLQPYIVVKRWHRTA